MPEHASRFGGLYDQQNENRIPDWGGDELFTRMPSPPAVDDAPAPRFRPSLTLVDTPVERRRAPSAEEAVRERAERLGLAPNGRRTKVITGRPDGAPKPLALVPADRRRPARTPAEWIGPRPERIVAWAFVLGLLLILIAISTADAATL